MTIEQLKAANEAKEQLDKTNTLLRGFEDAVNPKSANRAEYREHTLGRTLFCLTDNQFLTVITIVRAFLQDRAKNADEKFNKL